MFLRDGGWHCPVFSGRADKGRGSAGRLSGVNRLFEIVRHLRHGRRLEKSRGFDLDFRNVVDVPENVRGKERISARCEEIVVDSDLLQLEDLGPAFAQQSLEVRSWRYESRRRRASACESQLRRQADALHFAGRPFWNFADDDYLARDLEVGDVADGELTYFFRRSDTVRPQHD